MSEFDKEAEREKLREKYEHEEEKREATEQMSELLLKGATMTNAHCSDCGDPIFRYDGQEFCPTCEKAVERNTGGADGEGDGQEGTEQGGIEVTDPSEGTRVSFGAPAGEQGAQPDGEAAESRDGAAGQSPRGTEANQRPSQQNEATQQRSQHQGADATRRAQQPQPTPSRGEAGGTSQPSRTSGGDGIAAARESLVAALARFSEQAAATDDPRRARDHLAAAREAAEALDALDR